MMQEHVCLQKFKSFGKKSVPSIKFGGAYCSVPAGFVVLAGFAHRSTCVAMEITTYSDIGSKKKCDLFYGTNGTLPVVFLPKSTVYHVHLLLVVNGVLYIAAKFCTYIF